MDLALKAAPDLEPGILFTERQFGLLELHASERGEIEAAGNAILAGIGAQADDQLAPATLFADIIENVPDQHAVILDRMRTWNVFSNSSPVEGITKAIRTFYDPGKKISIYVFGDEFTGESIAQVVDTVDQFNREDQSGNRLVRIHAVGFPVQFIRQPHLQGTGIRFATLMRELTHRNGGTFVGLNDFR